MCLTPDPTIAHIGQQEFAELLTCCGLDEVQGQLYFGQLFGLQGGLECANLFQPAGWPRRWVCKDVIPSMVGPRGRQTAQKIQSPGGRTAIAATDPVAFGVRGATRVGLDEGRTIKTDTQEPDEFQGGTVLRVEHLDDHRAVWCRLECANTGVDLGSQEPVYEILLPVVVRAEIKSSIGRVDVGIGTRGGKHVLITEMIEVAGVIGAIHDLDIGVLHQESVGLPPAGDSSLCGPEGHGKHGRMVTRAVLDSLQEPTGTLGSVGRHERAGPVGVKLEGVPEFDHLEIRTGEGCDGRDAPVLAALE